MDRLEKEWFDLVSARPSCCAHGLACRPLASRRRTCRNPTWPCPRKIPLAPYATTPRARTRTLSSSATDATSPSTRVRSHDMPIIRSSLILCRLLRCAIHPRRPVALPKMHRVARKPCRRYHRPSALSPRTLTSRRSHVSCARMREAHSSRRYMVHGCICSARSGCRRPECRTRCSWSL